MILALSDEPHTNAPGTADAKVEEAVAEALERRTAEGSTVLLHDRRMPGGRGNVDHIAVAPSGVYVIDTKDLTGKVCWSGDYPS